MKKNISVLIIILSCIFMMPILTSCSSNHPINEFKETMENADNYQVSITVSDVPFIGTFTMITKVDGNIQYTPAVLFNDEQYIETVENVKYKYTKDTFGKWVKEIQEDAETNDDEFNFYDDKSMEALFNPENYEESKDEKNTFIQKSDVNFDNFEDVKIKIENNSCTIEMKIYSSGIICGAKMVISKIGEIELTLPKID